MKNLILSAVTILLFLNNAIAQQYVPMPTNDAVWKYRLNNMGSGVPGTQYNYQLMVTGNDTVINTLTYKKVMLRYNVNSTSQNSDIADSADRFYAGIREDNKRVYVSFPDQNWPFFTDTSKNRLLYDFNLNIGDTIPPPDVRYYTMYHDTITGIDSVLVGTKYHKRFKTSNTGMDIIEGIGTSEGLFYYDPIMYSVVTFKCFGYQNNIYHPYPSEPCGYIWPKGTPASVSNVDKEKTRVYPNPFSDQLKIESENGKEVSIYNATGQLVLRQNITGDKQHISTATLNGGMYYLTVKDSQSQTIHSQKLVRQ